MSGSIKIRIRSGRKSYSLEVQNVNSEEKHHNIQIVLPEHSEPINDDEPSNGDASRAINNFLEQIMGSNLPPSLRGSEMQQRSRARPHRHNGRRDRNGSTRERNQEQHNVQSEPADVTIIENPSHLNRVSSEQINSEDATIVENTSNLNRVSSEQINYEDAKIENDMRFMISENAEYEPKEAINFEQVDLQSEEDPDDSQNEEDPEDNDDHKTFMSSIQQAIVQSMTGRPIAEEQKDPSIWNIMSDDMQIITRSGDPARPPIAFDTLVSGHPSINSIRQTNSISLNFYKEIIVNFDIWIRSAMNSSNTDIATFTKFIDKMFGIYLLKFPRVISDNNFDELIRIMEIPTQNETQITKETRERLKTAIIALKGGILSEIAKLLDTPNCACPRCAL